jgi:hypothetical protein
MLLMHDAVVIALWIVVGLCSVLLKSMLMGGISLLSVSLEDSHETVLASRIAAASQRKVPRVVRILTVDSYTHVLKVDDASMTVADAANVRFFYPGLLMTNQVFCSAYQEKKPSSPIVDPSHLVFKKEE